MDSLMRATIGCMKQLEYALTLLFSPKTSEAKTCFLGMFNTTLHLFSISFLTVKILTVFDIGSLL